MTTLAATPVTLIPVALIDACPWNIRKVFDPERTRELADSLRSPIGQTDAILLRPHPTAEGRYEIANGERRWRAAQIAGLSTLAAKVCDLTDDEVLDIMLATGSGGNVESLTPLEEAAGYRRRMEMSNFTLEQLAKHLGRPFIHVHRRISLLDLPENARTAVESGELPPRTAWLIARIPGEKIRAATAAIVLKRPVVGGVMSVAEAHDYIVTNVCRSLQGAPFDVKDAALMPSAGACSACPYRAGNNPEEYGDVTNPHTCMSPGCYADKLRAHQQRVVTKVAVDGKIPLAEAENDLAFPIEEKGLNWKSPFVPYNERPTPDVLKAEVTTPPTWRELTAGSGVQIYVGVHQDGHAVELVKRAEAIAAADVNEKRIFNESELKRAVATRPTADHIAAADASAQAESTARDAAQKSRAAQEKAEKTARLKVEKAQKKKEKAGREWLAQLLDTLATAKGPKAWQHLPYWSLLYELAADALSPEEIAMVMLTVDENATAEECTRSGLDAYAADIGVPWMAGLVTVMLLAPRVRAAGAESELVKEWHQAIIATPDVETEAEASEREEAEAEDEDAATETVGETASEIEKRHWKEMAKAHADGMPILEIARSYGQPVVDVCGLLEVPVPADAPELPAHCAPYQVREIIGYDNAGKTLAEMAEYMHRDREWVRAVILACGRRDPLFDEQIFELSTQVHQMLVAAGHDSPRKRDTVAKLACKKNWSACGTLEDLNAVKACLDRMAAAKAATKRGAAATEQEAA